MAKPMVQCKQWSHNSYKLFWRKNPQKILLSIFNFDLNVNKCPILPLFTVPNLKYVNVLQIYYSLYFHKNIYRTQDALSPSQDITA
jgi:hypothetical protein